MKINKLLPTKKQFSSWTLPSKASYIGLFIGIFALILAVLALQYGATKKGQEDIKNTIKKTSGVETQGIQIMAEEMKKLNANFGDKINQDKLMQKYNLGYVLFEINHKKSIFPYDTHIIDQYKLDWSVVKLKSLKKNKIELYLPNLYDKNGKALIENTKITMPYKIRSFGGYFVNNLSVVGEILEIRENGVVFLVGFAKFNSDLNKKDFIKKIGEEISEKVHTLYNKEDIKSIWDLADSTFKKKMGYKPHEKIIKKIIKSLGKYISSSDTKWWYEDKDQGTLITITQRSIFQKKEVDELFTIQFEKGAPYLVGWVLSVRKKVNDQPIINTLIPHI